MSSPTTLLSPPRRRLAIATACAGGFLAFLDTTIVNTAFPGIAASFPGASASGLAWVLDAYFIVIAALLVPAGGLADRIGRKRVFGAGVVLFTAASGLAAAAPGLEALIAARALQGAGAAVLMAVSLALILPEYPVARRASAVALWGASAALAAASGPPLGGALVELGWRWVFVVNLPLGAAVLLAGRAAFVERRDTRLDGLPDLLGAALIMGGLGALALAILEGGTWGWTSPRVLGAFAAAMLLLAATAHRCRTHPRPVLDPALLRIASFRRANVGLLLLGMAFFSTILANVLFLTSVWGYSVLTAGLAVVPGAIATAAVAVPAGRIAERYGQSAVIVPGCLLYVAGMALVRAAGTEPAFASMWLPAMLLNGAGLGLAFPALAAAALKDVPAEHFGAASAITNATRQLGGVLGVAVLFAVGAPITVAAAEDAYLVSTLWALGAALIAATRVLTLPVIAAGLLVFAAPAAAQQTEFIGPIVSKPKQVARPSLTAVDDPDEGGQVRAADLAVTRTAITTPAGPVYRLYEREIKAEEPIRVVGTTDGADGDLLDLVCGGQRVATNVGVKGGRFETTVPLDKFKPAMCVLRAVPDKFDGKDLDPFTGPPVSVTYYDPRALVTGVLESEGTAALDYAVESGHRRGQAKLGSSGRGGLLTQFGVRPVLDRFARATWSGAAAISDLTVDGGRAYVGAMIPLVDVEGRRYAPAGFAGVASKVGVDEATGEVIVLERAAAYRCDAKCLKVTDAGVRLERTTTFTAEHAVLDVQDRWVATDQGVHAVRVAYQHGSGAARWRFPGEAAFRAPAPVEAGAKTLLTHDGTPEQAMGAVTLDPVPPSFAFATPNRATDTVTLTTPGTVRRSFEVGENLVQEDPRPDPPTPTPGAPQHPGDPQPELPGRTRCVVPKIRAGTTVKAARAALRQANCAPGVTRKARSTKVRRGRVIAFARTAGKRLPPGTKVGIKVSRGRR